MALLRCGRAAGAMALAALAGACGDFVRPPEFVPGDPNQLLVHAVLHAESDSARVRVSRVGSGSAGTPVTGARVRLMGSAGEAVLREVPEGSLPCTVGLFSADPFDGVPGGCYEARVPGGVRAGAEYQLEVELATGERARGRTVVPHPPAAQAPADGLRLPAEASGGWLMAAQPLTLRWTAGARVGVGASMSRSWPSPPAAGQCAARLFRPRLSEEPVFLPDELLADSVGVKPAGTCLETNKGPQLAPDSADVEVRITAYDSAYHAYIAEWNNGIPASDAAGGLEGAYGVFGSAATATRRVRLVLQRP